MEEGIFFLFFFSFHFPNRTPGAENSSGPLF